MRPRPAFPTAVLALTLAACASEEVSPPAAVTDAVSSPAADPAPAPTSPAATPAPAPTVTDGAAPEGERTYTVLDAGTVVVDLTALRLVDAQPASGWTVEEIESDEGEEVEVHFTSGAEEVTFELEFDDGELEVETCLEAAGDGSTYTVDEAGTVEVTVAARTLRRSATLPTRAGLPPWRSGTTTRSRSSSPTVPAPLTSRLRAKTESRSSRPARRCPPSSLDRRQVQCPPVRETARRSSSGAGCPR